MALVVAVGACDDDPTGNDSGTLEVQVSRSGAGTDANGFTVSVDNGSQTKAVSVADTVDFALDAGNHTVGLTGMSANCTVGGNNPRPVTIQTDSTSTVSFAVTCTAS